MLIARQRARHPIRDAQRPQDVAFGRDEGGARVEAQVGIACDEGIGGEAEVFAGVRDDQEAGQAYGLGVEGGGAGRLSDVAPDDGLEPLAVPVQEGDRGDRRPAERGSQPGGIVVGVLGGRVQDIILPQCLQAFGLIVWQRGRRRGGSHGSLFSCKSSVPTQCLGG